MVRAELEPKNAGLRVGRAHHPVTLPLLYLIIIIIIIIIIFCFSQAVISMQPKKKDLWTQKRYQPLYTAHMRG